MAVLRRQVMWRGQALRVVWPLLPDDLIDRRIVRHVRREPGPDFLDVLTVQRLQEILGAAPFGHVDEEEFRFRIDGAVQARTYVTGLLAEVLGVLVPDRERVSLLAAG